MGRHVRVGAGDELADMLANAFGHHDADLPLKRSMRILASFLDFSHIHFYIFNFSFLTVADGLLPSRPRRFHA